MSARTLRRRLHHADVDGNRKEHFSASGYDPLSEPLLGHHHDHDAATLKLEEIWNAEEMRESNHWTLVLSKLVAQWAQWLANIVLGSGSLIGRFLQLPFVGQSEQKGKLLLPYLSSLQEERLRTLRQRLGVPFDGSRLDHQDALRRLWRLAFPHRELPSLKSIQWKEMGWQGSDPSTDFRGGGFISLENLIYFATTYPEAFQRLLHKKDGIRSEWEYPFAVAGVNISFMLAQMLDLQTGKPSTQAGIRFLHFLEEDEMAFDNLYCVAFQMMDAQWLAQHASYMQFNDVMKSTRDQLERELALEGICSVKNLQAYSLLRG